MAEQFDCPSCGAPLEYDGSGNASMRCPYCNNAVVVPEALRTVRPAAPPVAPPSPAPLVSLAGSPMNLQQAEQLIRQIDTLNVHLINTGLQATAKVLQYMPLGINVNGNNPAATLIVEVHPTSRPAFTAEAQCPIALAHVPWFQPGKMITVRYNPGDLTKVAVVPFSA